MDRRGPKSFLSPISLVLACAAVAAAQAATDITPEAKVAPIRAARWLVAADPARVLTEQPSECLATPSDPQEAWLSEVGRAVFRSPGLLGGQAAKAGLSCESCHRNGRGNPQFALPGVSGAPGTADITSSLFSTRRGDGMVNPQPIPDLGAAPASPLVSRSTDAMALEPFLHDLVTEEFDGPEPAPAVMRGLTTYIRQVSYRACPKPLVRAVSAAGTLDSAGRAVRAAQGALARGDAPTAITLLDAARFMLGDVDERFAAPGLDEARGRIRTASLDLGSALSAVRRGADARPLLELWLVRSAGLKAALERGQARSYYDRRTLTAAMGAAALGQPPEVNRRRPSSVTGNQSAGK